MAMEEDKCCDAICDDNDTISSLQSPKSTNDEENDSRENSELYFFFSGADSLINLTLGSSFITKLVVIGQPIQCIEGLNKFELLKELWIVECSIQKIENLQSCIHLEKLYLYSNNISEIEGLDNLKKLHTLWLSGNKITIIKNIQQLQELKELYLCQNGIQKIGSSLLYNKKLKTLNLSGNPLCNLNDTIQLLNVEYLKFSDPIFQACPLTYLCNYRPFIVFHLKKLKFLDLFEVDEEERVKTLDYLRRKIMYYSMLQNQLKYRYYHKLHKKAKDASLTMNKYKDNLYNLKVEELQVQHDENISTSSKAEYITMIKSKQDFIEFHIKNWSFQETQDKSFMAQRHRIHASQINVELLYGGNIKFTTYPNEINKLNIFQKLMNTFNCPDIFEELGISSVKVCDVTKVINKGIQSLNIYLRERITSKKKSWKYYLLSRCHDAKGFDAWPFSIVEHGFIDVQETSVNVTNCIAISDYDWLTNIKKKLDSSFGYHGLNISKRRTATIVKTQKENLFSMPHKEGYLSHRRDKRRCSNCCKIFKPKHAELLCPVFVIEYEYIFKDCFVIKKQELYSSYGLCPSDKNLRQEITKLDILNTDTLPLKISEDLWNSITKLSLQACNIETIGKLPSLPNINVIDLSYNKLVSFGGLDSFPNITVLDASFNNICTISDMPVLNNLKRLDISWNYLGNAMSVTRTLKRCSPNLKNLEMSFNPIDDIKDLTHLICFVRDCSPKVYQFNGKLIDLNFKVVKSVSQMGPSLNQEIVDEQCNSSYLTTMWKCERLYDSLMCTKSLSLHRNNETVCIVWKNEGIDIIECSEELNKLQWANFDDNFIRNLEFLNKCLFLEELSMSNNILKNIDNGLKNLHKLVKLDLSNNHIVSISPLSESCLPSLEIFNISNNQLSSLYGIEACPTLTEFYSYYNLIETLDDLDAIKTCINLIVLDLSSNKIEMENDFKAFILFYLPMIEVINGKCVDKSHVAEAKLVFGGCLDQDYLIRQNKLANAKLITELTMNNCSFKKINLKASTLPNLLSLDLSNNNVSSLWGLHDLPKLQTLCLSYNRVTCLSTNKEILSWLTARNEALESEINPTSQKQHNRIIGGVIFSKLKTLYLNNNGLQSLIPLCLDRMHNLKSLFLQRNELGSIKGIRAAKELKHLVLDGNKIEYIDEFEMSNLSNLEDLYLENNGIKDLTFMKNLTNLQRLFLRQNKIQDEEQLKHLASLIHLEEITLFGNPLFRNTYNYWSVVKYSPLLNRIDGFFLNLKNSNKQEKKLK